MKLRKKKGAPSGPVKFRRPGFSIVVMDGETVEVDNTSAALEALRKCPLEVALDEPVEAKPAKKEKS